MSIQNHLLHEKVVSIAINTFQRSSEGHNLDSKHNCNHTGRSQLNDNMYESELVGSQVRYGNALRGSTLKNPQNNHRNLSLATRTQYN